ncbi:MAG: DJ-1/PfpI family protein [Brevinema sp.]
MKNIIVLLADSFEDIEAIAPIDIWRRSQFQVTTASISQSLKVSSQQKIIIQADKLLSEIHEESFDAIFIPGGAGHKLIQESPMAMAFIDRHIKDNALIIAICAGSTIIKKYLINKKATCYPAMKELIPHWVDEKVVFDAPFVTAQGAGVSLELGYFVSSLFSSEEETIVLKKQMVFKH